MSTIKIKPVVSIWNCKACKVSEQTAVVWSSVPTCLCCGYEMEYSGIAELLEIELPVVEESAKCD